MPVQGVTASAISFSFPGRVACTVSARTTCRFQERRTCPSASVRPVATSLASVLAAMAVSLTTVTTVSVGLLGIFRMDRSVLPVCPAFLASSITRFPAGPLFCFVSTRPSV